MPITAGSLEMLSSTGCRGTTRRTIMLRKFAAGLLATALIAGPALAQTPTTTPSGNTPAASAPTINAPATKTVPVKAAPSSPMAAPTATDAKQTANPTKAVKHVKLHKKSVKRVASRSHVKSGKMHQVRHTKSVKSHQAKIVPAKIAPTKTGDAAKRS